MAITATSLGTGLDKTSPFTMNTSADVPSGALVVCCIGFIKTGSGAVTLSVSDGVGLTWTQDKYTNADVASSTFNIGIAVFSAPAPSGLASGTTVTVGVAGGTADLGVYLGMMYLTGVDTGASRVDVTAGQVRDVGVATSTWSSTSASTTNANDGLVGAAWADDTSTSSTPGGSFSEVFDVHDVTGLDWSLTGVFSEVLSTGSYSATGTWSSAPQADAGILVAYRSTGVIIPSYSLFPRRHMRRN